MSHVVVVGAGIIGMATAARLARAGHQVTILEKELDLAEHQTGRTSGIVHSGLYPWPGSRGARLGLAGHDSMSAFLRANQVPFEECGSLVVATDAAELARLRTVASRARADGVPVRVVSPQEAQEYEPHVRSMGALRVESTGITDYSAVCRVLARRLREDGGEILFGHTFHSARTVGREVWVTTDHGTLTASAVVVCGGVHADRLARSCGLHVDVRIVPFLAEYHELVPEAAALVRGLVAPVPDERFPFLGVHLTRMVHGGVHAGPNALLAPSREAYRRSNVSLPDLRDTLSWPGLWYLAADNLGAGAREAARALSRRWFARRLARLIPDLGADHLIPSVTAVRAQAVTRDGELVQDYLLQSIPRQVHVLNAPSPAASAAFEIARRIEQRLGSVTPDLAVARRGQGPEARAAS